MKATIEISEIVLAEMLKTTGQQRSGQAFAFAVQYSINRKKAKDFGRILREGKFDYEYVGT
jgi:hypothetical protein